MTTTITPAALTGATSLEAARMRSAQIEADLAVNPGDYRMLSGDRPTGGLHLGHLIGSLANRVRLQEMGVPTTILIADYQVITDREHIGPVGDRVQRQARPGGRRHLRLDHPVVPVAEPVRPLTWCAATLSGRFGAGRESG